MEEESVSELLTQHFKKVNQCLENQRNFDILTRFSFCSSSDKSIDHNDYLQPELEYAQEKVMSAKTSNLNTLFEDSSSEFLREETNSGYLDENDEDCSSTIVDASNDESKSKVIEADYEDLPIERFFRERFVKRPETPMLNMYEFDESEICSVSASVPAVGRMEASKKFIHSVSLPILNDSVTSSEDQIVLSVSNFDESDTEAVNSKIFDTVQSRDSTKLAENEITFENELEEYKKEIKVEKAIRSLSANDTIPHIRTTSRINISKCDSCFRAFKREDRKAEFRLPLPNEFSDLNRMNNMNSKFEVPPNIGHTAEYLRYLLEESSTNICQGLLDSESSLDFGLFQRNSGTKLGRLPAMDDDMIESVLEKFLKSHMTNGKSNAAMPEELGFRKKVEENIGIPFLEINLDRESYIKLNHLEIQKEMTRRIEDMYKAGDGN